MNRLGFIAALVAAALGATGAGAAGPGSPGASLCVTNASAQRYHFTVRAIDEAVRVGRDLAPGETLCLDHDGRGVAAAFETAQSLEGCSRLLPAGGSERLITFGRFDRCAWAAPDG